MDKPQNERTVLFLVIIVVTLGIVVGHILSWKLPTFNDNTDNLSAVVTVENTLMVNGILPVPQGFPEDIPLESGEIVESATTYHPSQNAEYKDYMNQAGYSLTEEDTSSGARVLFGTKGNVSLSVTIKNADNRTLVELSYLSK